MNIYRKNTAQMADIIAYRTPEGRKYCVVLKGYNVRRAKALCKRSGVTFESIQRQKF